MKCGEEVISFLLAIFLYTCKYSVKSVKSPYANKYNTKYTE